MGYKYSEITDKKGIRGMHYNSLYALSEEQWKGRGGVTIGIETQSDATNIFGEGK